MTKKNKEQGQDDRRSFLSKISLSSATWGSSGLFPTVATAATNPPIVTPQMTKETSWPLGKVAFSLLPLAGTSTRRATVEEEVVPNRIWTHDQIQGVVNVNVPVRQVVVKLSGAAGGGLWVHNPVAPTPQLLGMVRKLEATHGPVRHIVLGTVALEHKATFGPFCQNFPKATVWVQPGQWAFPIGLPIDTLGVTQRGSRLREIPVDGRPLTSDIYYANDGGVGPPEWMADFETETLGPLEFQSVGAFSETAFLHKNTKTLIVTDTVISVTKDPPPIIQEDPRAMLFHSRDRIDQFVEDTPETRQRGWRRMVQFGLVFFPSQIDVIGAGEALRDARRVKDPSQQALGKGAIPLNLYPWKWHDNDVDLKNFEEISQNGKIFCPPILTKLILDREPTRTLEWVDRVTERFDFDRIIPAHLNNNVAAKPSDFYHAFDMLRSTPGRPIPQRALAEDLSLLQKASDLLTRVGVVGPSLVCDGELARRKGRFASQ